MHRLFYLLLIPIIFFTYRTFHKNKKTTVADRLVNLSKKRSDNFTRLKERAAGLLSYAKRKGFNSEYAFLVDMKQASGNKRFYIYNLQKDSLMQTGLVTHGYGSNNNGDIKFSNTSGSNCTSLGRYKIGNAYNGRFGLAFKLHGLDSTNSNAINRFVVLHSHPCVPDNEVFPQSICMSQGCPTVSTLFLQTLKTYIEKSKQPILLYIFY